MVRWLFLVLSLSAVGQDLGDLHRRLATIEEVSGNAVGYAGTPGAFYLLSLEYLQRGGPKDFQALLRDGDPVARSMGLVCLAQSESEQSKELLLTQLEDAARVLCYPGGCVGSTVSVGSLALELLLNPGYLGNVQPALLPKEAIPGLCLEILARDACSDLHRDAGYRLQQLEGLRLDLVALAEAAPGLKSWQLIKAVGRLQPTEVTRNFLSRSLVDRQLSWKCRQAAASALTRDGSDAARELLIAQQAWLDSIEPGAGSAFVAESALCAQVQGHWDPIHAVRTWKEMEEREDALIAAMACSHPSVFRHLRGAFSLAIVDSHKNVRDALIQGLHSLVEELDTCAQEWNSWATLPYEIQACLRDRADKIGTANCQELLDAIDLHLQSRMHSEDAQEPR